MKVNYDELKTCFDNLGILVIGDVILDHYLIGKVNRISPEAPVPVVLHEQEDFRLGGAANVALNIKAMGATPFLLAIIGEDVYGSQFLELLEKEGISTGYLLKDRERTTTCKTRILARNQQLLRYDQESTSWIDESLEMLMINKITTLLESKSIDAIVFQDYNKGVLTEKVIRKVIQLAKTKGIPTLADPKKTNFMTFEGIDFFKPNLREINEALNLNIEEQKPSVKMLAQASRLIQSQLHNHCTIITLGAKGIYYNNEEMIDLVATRERQIADVCGAGDTVISLLSLGIAAKLPLPQIVRLANIGGGQVCEKVGVVPVNKEALLTEFYNS